MTKITKVQDSKLKEEFTRIDHKSGLRAYIIPKDFSTKYAIIGTRCGGLDNEIRFKGSENIVFPYGMAHFLEHKLFANPDGEDTFEKFAETGAACNAYTSFDRTAYLFSVSDSFDRSLEILLKSYTQPYFTEENVENEASIISEEIKMYLDDPYDSIFFSMLCKMYDNPNVHQSVCGTVESVSSITPKMLYDYYNAYYRPENSVLCIAGSGVSEKNVIDILDKAFEGLPSEQKLEKPHYSESENVMTNKFLLEKDVSIPIFNIGIKITPPDKKDPRELVRHDIACNMICEHYFSECDEFLTSFYENGKVNHQIKFSYDSSNKGISMICLYGESELAEDITKAITEHICNTIPRTPLKENDLALLKNVLYAHYLSSFDSVSDIANEFLAYALDGIEYFEIPRLIDSIDVDYVNNIISKSFKKEKICVAIASQKKEDHNE